MSDDRFFHFASFRSEILKGIETRAIHYSLDGKFYEHIYDETFYFPYSGYTYQRFTFETPQFGLILYPKTKPIIHNCTSKGRNYYSIPHLEGEGFLYPRNEKIYASAWFDHEFSDFINVSYWDWLGIKLDAGVYVTVYKSDVDNICDVSIGNNTISSDFILEDKHLYIQAISAMINLEPEQDEMIFKPKFGFKYSELQIDIIGKGKKIGYGMRERMYRRDKNAF